MSFYRGYPFLRHAIFYKKMDYPAPDNNKFPNPQRFEASRGSRAPNQGNYSEDVTTEIPVRDYRGELAFDILFIYDHPARCVIGCEVGYVL